MEVVNPYDQLTAEERVRVAKLFDDVLPFYTRIAVGVPDKGFISAHHESCVRMALAGKQAVLSLGDVKPEDAIYSDEHFARCIEYAWQHSLTELDKVFLNEHLQHAAECFRIGFMLADLPEL
ncbi:MAG: hypothetical protein K6E86_02500 [Bacteroidales bacterium]|nr:hypothetical protein [Bacteroidales bacterium]